MYTITIIRLIICIYTTNTVQSLKNQTFKDNRTKITARRSDQITTILDGLLRDYQAHIRPNFGGSIAMLFRFLLSELDIQKIQRKLTSIYWLVHLVLFKI